MSKKWLLVSVKWVESGRGIVIETSGVMKELRVLDRTGVSM